MKSDALSQRLFWGILTLIVIASFVIRLMAIGHGQPNIQITDENSDLSTALRLTEGELPRREVRYHRSLIAYVDMASVGGLFGYSALTGRTSDLSSFRNLYFSDRSLFTLATRLTLALLTSAAIALTALAGRYISPLVGLLAAAVLTVNGFFTLNSLYALPDSLISFAIALCIWMTMRLWFYKRQRDYFLAGVSVAVVMLSKFSGSTVAIGILIAHAGIVWGQSNQNWRQFLRNYVLNRGVLWLIVGCVVGNLVINPIAFLHPDDLIYEITRLNSYAYGNALSLGQRVQLVVDHVMGIIPLIWRFSLLPCVLGIVALRRYRQVMPYWIMLGAFLFLMLTIANVNTIYYQAYYWIPWVIVMALLAGVGLEALVGWLGQLNLRWVGYIAVALLIVAEGSFLIKIITLQTATDTRQLALQYLQENWPADMRVVAGDTVTYAVPIQRDETSIQRAYSLGQPPLQSWDWWLGLPPDRRPGPAYDVYGPEMQATVKSYDALNSLMWDEQIGYLIDDDYCVGTDKRPESESGLEFPAINDTMRGQWELVVSFSPFDSTQCEGLIDSRIGLAVRDMNALSVQARPGPIIRIYRVSETPSS